jgi:phenylpropionate dioxygenase-like ring-hydroxylating dioxygenase large terminal subunit
VFQHRGKLAPQLPPEAYFDAAPFERERDRIFRIQWHPVAARVELERPGQQVARHVAGVPVVVRNFDGALRGFENVCVHRHSLLVNEGCSAADRLRCQYHGWEYDEAGRVAKLPDGASFKGLKTKGLGLTGVRVETFGPMVFVNLSAHGPSVRETFGGVADEVEAHFSAHRLAWTRTVERPVNWKVIVENAVESYHVPVVHPETFAYYRDEALHEHELAPTFTRYLDLEPWSTSRAGRVAALAARLFRPSPTMRRMTHVHVFPTILAFYGDLVSDFQVVEPLGPERSRHVSWGFFPVDAPRGTRTLHRIFNLALDRRGRKVSQEDLGIWTAVQAGKRHARSDGVLSAREERVFAFQDWVRRTLDGPTAAAR